MDLPAASSREVADKYLLGGTSVAMWKVVRGPEHVQPRERHREQGLNSSHFNFALRHWKHPRRERVIVLAPVMLSLIGHCHIWQVTKMIVSERPPDDDENVQAALIAAPELKEGYFSWLLNDGVTSDYRVREEYGQSSERHLITGCCTTVDGKLRAQARRSVPHIGHVIPFSD